MRVGRAVKLQATVAVHVELSCACKVKLNHAHFGRLSTVVAAVDFNLFNCWFLLIHSYKGPCIVQLPILAVNDVENAKANP